MTNASSRSFGAPDETVGGQGLRQWRWRDVLAVLREHEVAIPSEEGLAAIQRHARELFLNLLSALSSTERVKATAALRAMLASVSPDMVSLLASHNLTVNLDALATIAGVRPRLLSQLLQAIKEGDSAARIEGLDGVRALLPHAPVDVVATEELMSPGVAPSPQSSAVYASVHVYGANYALCFNAGSRASVPGIMLDAAVSSSAGYDWGQAVHIWLSIHEVGELLAVMRRWRAGLIFANHGRTNEKSFEVQAQSDHLFAKVMVRHMAPHGVRGVRIQRRDAQAIALLCTQVLREAHPELPIQEVLSCLRDVHCVGGNAVP